MKKFYYLIGFMIIALLAVKIIFIYRAKDYQLNQYSDILSKQIYLCNSNIEEKWSRFENDLNYLRNYETISILLNNRSKNQIDKFELFFSKYIDLIEQINIYSSTGNTFAIYKDENNLFHSQFSSSDTKENTLEDKERVILYEQEYFYNLPVFNKNKLYANILFTIDFNKFILKEFKEHEIGYAGWQGLIDNKGNILVSNNIEKNFRTEDLSLISKNLNKGTDGFIDHSISFKDREIKMLSIYKEVNFIKNKFGIIFSIQTSKIFYSYYKSFISSLIVGVLLLFLLIVAGVFLIKYNNKQVFIQNETIKKFENILESLPIGVLVTDKNKKVSMANMAAINMLHMENQSEVVGHNISNKLINAKNHISKDTREYNFDANKYIYYDKTGEEIVLYKKEIPLSYENKNLSLEGFIDISPIEKARKLEIAANNSKSEFLAKMTHEIRTPMNGIIGMAEVLVNQDLTEEQKESARIILKSADLLLSIINDILDFSKIEAGKMLLEEVPFKLFEEINLTLALFRPKAQEKGIEIKLNISSRVPNNIIGDPFRLRQVIANLLSNAVKFTHEGEIVISIEFIKESLGDLTLLFTVEDTGIGIPKENLDSIFGSYNQAEGSTSRRYGGTGLGTTIAKQLVELMNGEIWVESPSSISNDPNYPGAKFGFTIECFSNEKLEKEFDYSKVIDFKDIKVLIIGDDKPMINTLTKATQNFGITSQITPFQKDTLELIRRNPPSRDDGFKIIFILDSYDFDGFFVCRKMFDNGLSDKFLMIMLSSNDKIGNVIKSKRLGIDYYLVRPFELSEIFDIIQDNFPNIQIDEAHLDGIDKLRKDLEILVAEDNLINQKVAQKIFKRLGFEIDLAKNGEEAVLMTKNKKYDVIFMDLLMPVKNGIEATQEIRKNRINIPIIAMTADTTDEDKQMSIDAGMTDFIYKPAKTDTVKRVLVKWFSESVQTLKEQNL